ncbi:magnesium transporter [Acetitomaculum ruminis DSM 5522]|uniref:Magnesium transporter n=1 Tax=Acetitomaculum ruminis DSM 5522 TaxID=1120918 RepID=A0A1I0W6A7_9FIRM|nr:magnesium transporter CorA family protein [Acetitomaculum ruminis]SFA84275.1 magnesium transporter [Acetitomaculum ruminis DSM 5522]
MYKIYKTDNSILVERPDFEDEIWINMIAPDMDESRLIAQHYNVDLRDIRAALDEEESSRVELEEEYTLMLMDIPSEEIRNNRNAYTTIPLGILIVKNAIITVCNEDSIVLAPFLNNSFKGGFSTKKRMRFIYQILYRTAVVYQLYLRGIDKRRTEIEDRASRNETEESDLFDLHELESNLVYFATSLSANKVVLERMTRYERIKQYPEDKELLGDVIVENGQAMEMTNIYRDIVHGTRELISTIINNKLNDIMKILTSVTLVMAIPTVISGLYGMNVNSVGMPFANEESGFAIISVITIVICIITLILLRKKRML